MRQKRCFLIDEEVISCSNCDLNYTEPGFCQEFSFRLDNQNDAENRLKAKDCQYWFPKEKLSRVTAKADAPHHVRWYELESAC